jgi:lipoprotein-anchoring transpeptidase ErfK/SrfK
MQNVRQLGLNQTAPSARCRDGLALAAAAIGCALASIPSPGHAFIFDMGQRSAYPEFARPPVPAQRPARTSQLPVTAPAVKAAINAAAKDNDLAAKAKGTLAIIVSLDAQQLTLYADGEPIAHSRVSSGKAGHSTPTGVFSVIQKDRWHHSNLYDDAPMYFMQRLTWSGVALHQGIVPNYPASHGCVRLPEAFAKQLWGITKPGVRVIIGHGDLKPADISHPRLFAPRHEPLEAKVDQSAPVPQTVQGSSETPRLRFASADLLTIAAMTFSEAKATSLTEQRFADSLVEPAPFGAVPPAGSAPAPKSGKSGPVSVFISRKEGRLFVRRSFEPLFDVPVTIDHPEQPLGTHVFSALATKGDSNDVRWTVVSIPGADIRAAGALDRIAIPQEAVARISELMSPGASLIVSDQGLGPETGVGTDFIVLTR